MSAPCESDERALDCLRDCVRWGRPRGPGALSDGRVRAQRDRNTIKRRLTASAGDGGRRKSVDILRQERGLANFDHPRLVALNEFLAQTGLRISVLTLGLSTLSLSALVALALSLFLSHLWMAAGDRPGRRLAERRRLSGDRSPTADRCLHRSIAGRAQHHRAQLADRPPARERHWTCVQGNARPDRGPSSP